MNNKNLEKYFNQFGGITHTQINNNIESMLETDNTNTSEYTNSLLDIFESYSTNTMTGGAKLKNLALLNEKTINKSLKNIKLQNLALLNEKTINKSLKNTMVGGAKLQNPVLLNKKTLKNLTLLNKKSNKSFNLRNLTLLS